MQVKLADTAYKAINRFKNLSVWDVEEAAQRFIEEAENFCEQAMGTACFECYDPENNVTLFCESVNSSELVVYEVRRGNLAGVF